MTVNCTSSATKRCPRCGETKPCEEFYRNRSRPDGRTSHCAACSLTVKNTEYRVSGNHRRQVARKSHLRVNYGLTPEQYDDLLRQQGGLCAICRGSNPDSRWGTFHVDHNHATGEIRGLLCAGCNLGLGKFQDDPERLLRAAAYLTLTKQGRPVQ